MPPHVYVISLSAIIMTVGGCRDRGSDAAQKQASLVEDLRLDANAEDFSSVRNVLVGPKGQIVIPLRQDAQVRIYDSTGKRVASVGRRGQAPGEFQALGAMGFREDTLWVEDSRTRRFTYFAPDGALLRTGGLPGGVTQPTPFEPALRGYSLIMVGAMYSDGSMLAGGLRARQRDPVDRDQPEMRDMLQISAAGDLRIVATQPFLYDERWMMQVSGFGRPVPFAGMPFIVTASYGSRFAFLTTEITSAAGGAWTLSLFRANGDTIFVKSFPFIGVSIPAAAKDSAVAAEITGTTEGPTDLDKRFQQVARERMPPVYAPVQALVLGMDETIWITLRDSANVRTTLVLDGMGNQVGRIATSPKSRVWQATASRVWMTEVDDNDLASVVRYKVIGLSRIQNREY